MATVRRQKVWRDGGRRISRSGEWWNAVAPRSARKGSYSTTVGALPDSERASQGRPTYEGDAAVGLEPEERSERGAEQSNAGQVGIQAEDRTETARIRTAQNLRTAQRGTRCRGCPSRRAG